MTSEREHLPVRAFQWDLARQVERLDWLVAQLPRYADWGYQELYLHLEDALEYPSLPGVARKDAYTRRQMARLVGEAGRWGLRVVPIVNLWGHTQYLLKVPEWRDLNELRAADGSPLPRGQVCPLHPRTIEVAGKLLRDVAPFCTAGKVHVGLDESYGLGGHPLSRAEIAEVGLGGHFSRYVGRLHGLAAGFGLRLGLWADMLALLPEAIPGLPAGIIAYDWYYYPFRRLPRLEPRNFQDYDLAAPLRARGIEYWGCPMNGAFRHEPLPVFSERMGNLASWWRRCRAVAAGGFLVTSWESNRLAMGMTTAVDAAAAGLWLDGDKGGTAAMMERGFVRAFGPRRGAAAAAAARGCDARAFSGYWRWEINSRWDACAGKESAGRFSRELDFFNRWVTRRRQLPPSLAASMAFRRYLAARDLFVRRAADGILRVRRPGSPAAGISRLKSEAGRFGAALKEGLAAARAMWSESRDRRRLGINEILLKEDGVRLRRWTRWLDRAESDPGLIRGATPVCGAWQFRCRLVNFAPALQQVVLEGRKDDGQWEALHRRFLIEFRAAAAAARTDIRREMNAPVDRADRPLRLAVRGLGQVRIEDIELTDGVTRLRPADRKPRILGRPAPKKGFPDLDWTRNQAEWLLRFVPPGR